VQRQTGGPGGNTSYYALDTAMYDGYGAKLGDTDAFTGGAEATRDAMGFQGQFGAYTDNETGLVLMGHRYYDAGTGRFLTRDPLGYGGGINLYGFTGNNPVNEMDPDGTQSDNSEPADADIAAITHSKRKALQAINVGARVTLAGTGMVADSLPGVGYFEAAYGSDSLGNPLSPGTRFLLAVPIFGTVLHRVGVGNAALKGFLKIYESTGGHTLAKHVGQSDVALMARLLTTRVSGSSSFASELIAEDVVGQTIAANRATIRAAAMRGDRGILLNYSGTAVIGRGAMRGEASVSDRTNASVILRFRPNGSFYVLTAFPR